MYKALKQFHLKMGPQTDTHTQKENGPDGSSVGRAGPGYLPRFVRSHRLEPPRWDSNLRPEVHDHDRLQGPRRQPLTGFGCQVGNAWTENVLSHQERLTHDPRCLAKHHDPTNWPTLLPQAHRLSTPWSRPPLLLLRREGLLLLATRLLIGRTHRAIPWPSSIGQAHGRRSPERRRLWPRPPSHLWPHA